MLPEFMNEFLSQYRLNQEVGLSFNGHHYDEGCYPVAVKFTTAGQELYDVEVPYVGTRALLRDIPVHHLLQPFKK